MDHEKDFEHFEEGPSNIEESARNAAEVLDAPIVGQTFGSWEELDRFISLYARSQNFASGPNVVKTKTNIVENQRQTRSKRSGCRWQVRATFSKKTGTLSISSVNLVHNDHLLENETNKNPISNANRAVSCHFFFAQDLSNAIQTFKRQNHVECEAAVLLNHLLERKAENARWIVNWKSTQRVEGQNGIIKHLVNSNTSLIDLVKHINEQIDHASTFVQYKNWIHSTTRATLIHASSEFSPDIDKWITAYLTPTSLSMQWQEIAQAIWYTSKLINNFLDLELQQSDLTDQLDITEQSDSIESLNTFIEDS
ncbi:22038_t:CDS:2, partial [Gigaspora rosea]